MFSYASDAKVSTYLPWQPHRSMADTTAFLKTRERAWSAEESFAYAICLHDDGRVVGMIETEIRDRVASLGYVLARPVWGLGIATEAATCLVGAVRGMRDVGRIWAVCDTENSASARVLEKSGLIFEGVLHKWIIHNVSVEPRDVRAYAWWR